LDTRGLILTGQATNRDRAKIGVYCRVRRTSPAHDFQHGKTQEQKYHPKQTWGADHFVGLEKFLDSKAVLYQQSTGQQKSFGILRQSHLEFIGKFGDEVDL